MILGILSDTHGNAAITASAVQVLKAVGAEAFIHCGDVGGAAVLDELAGLRAWFVWGNTDEPEPRLALYARSIGLTPPTGVPLRVQLAGHTLAVFHGHESRFARLADLAEAGDANRTEAAVDGARYVLFGHTHTRYDVRAGAVRFINPGALHRARIHSVATLDLRRDALRFWHVDAQRAKHSDAPREFPWAGST